MASRLLMESTDIFKKYFKLYKSKHIFESIHQNQIIDFERYDQFSDVISKADIKPRKAIDSPISNDFRDIENWQIFTLNKGLPGLYVIPQILTKEASKNWFNYFLNDVPVSYSNDLKSNIPLPPKKPIKNSNLCWITFGYNYDWDKKCYNPNDKSSIPPLIDQFAHYVSSSLGFEEFKTEAGIINYYRYNSTLCPHSDSFEIKKSSPLFSLSLGCSAIFLFGGNDRCSEPIIPMYLRDSDLLIMSSECRDAYHAVAKVFPQSKPQTNENADTNQSKIKRININIRQVY